MATGGGRRDPAADNLEIPVAQLWTTTQTYPLMPGKAAIPAEFTGLPSLHSPVFTNNGHDRTHPWPIPPAESVGSGDGSQYEPV